MVREIREGKPKVRGLIAATLLGVALVSAGCATHRVYDPYYHDYHPWHAEVVYYQQWETETHRDHVDFEKRSPDDQKAYWDWRHSHDQGHDHDNH